MVNIQGKTITNSALHFSTLAAKKTVRSSRTRKLQTVNLNSQIAQAYQAARAVIIIMMGITKMQNPIITIVRMP